MSEEKLALPTRPLLEYIRVKVYAARASNLSLDRDTAIRIVEKT